MRHKQERKTPYIRRCKKCDYLYKTFFKYSMICSKCNTSRAWVNVITDRFKVKA